MTRGEKLRALLVLAGFLALLAGTPVLLAWLTRQAPDLAVRWPSIDTGIFAPPVLVQLEHWWTQTTWPQLIFGLEDGDLIVWMVALIGWACWIVLVWHTLAELAVCLRLGAAYAHQRLTGIGPRAWISGAVTTVLIGLSPGTAHAAGPPRQPIAATAPQHPDRARGEAGHGVAPAIRESLTVGGVTDPQAPRQSDPFVLDADVHPELPRYTVVPGDTLWDLARRYLGDPQRYRDILDLNADRLPGGGGVLRPGWVLLLPAQATGLPGPGEPLPAGTTWVTVVRGDTLSSIAERHLGNGEEWTVLWQLNDHRRQPDGRVLRDPNLVLPGWRLAVPSSSTTAPPDTPSVDSGAGGHAGRDSANTTTTTTEPSPTPSPAPSPPPYPAGHPATAAQPAAGVRAGPGIFLAASLVAALSVAATTLALWHRRRYRPGSGDRDDLQQPPIVRALPLTLTPTPGPHRSEPPTPWPGMPVAVGVRENREEVLDLAGTHGIGLTGTGADEATRALLVTLLATHPDTRIVVPQADLRRLLGDVQPPSQLRIVDDLHAALGVLETELLTRTRETHRARDHHGWPPVLLVATPASQHTRRLRTVLDDGARLGLAAILLGSWPAGHTLTVHDDGVTGHADTAGLADTRLFHLPATATSDLLAFLDAARSVSDNPAGEDTTTPSTQKPPVSGYVDPPPAGQEQVTPTAGPRESQDTSPETPPRQTRPAPPVPASPRHDTEGRQPAMPAPGPAGTVSPSDVIPAAGSDTTPQANTSTKVQLRVLDRFQLVHCRHNGERDISDLIAPKQREILVYLALHRRGAAKPTLAATLWPDAPPERPFNNFHATLSQFRQALRRGTDGAIHDLINQTDGHYRLDADLVDVDLWRLHDALAGQRDTTGAADAAAGLDIAALYPGDLDEHLTAPWVQPEREALRRDVLDALHRVIEQETGTRARRVELLEHACRIDPYNETLHHDLAQTQVAHSQPDAALRTLDLLISRLGEIGHQPEPTTTSLRDSLTLTEHHRS